LSLGSILRVTDSTKDGTALRELFSIQVLRAFAAIAVAISHVSFDLSSFREARSFQI